MPIRSSLAVTLTLAIACGGFLVPAQAGDIDDVLVVNVQAQGRDLTPAPIRLGGAAVGQRPYVTLRPSSPVVRVGAPISFEVSSSVNGYGHIYVLSASGRVQVWMENVPITSGERLLFPTGSMGIRAAAPAGREDLMLIVTKERIDGFLGYGATRSPRVLEYDHQSFKQALTAKFIDLPRRQWGYARTSVQVVARSASGSDWDWGSGSGQVPLDRWAGQWETD